MLGTGAEMPSKNEKKLNRVISKRKGSGGLAWLVGKIERIEGAGERIRLGFSCPCLLQFFQGAFMLFELLSSLSQFSLRGEALVFLEFLDRSVYQLFHGQRRRAAGWRR